jgi:hypothetical protein
MQMDLLEIIVLSKIFLAQNLGDPIGFGDVWITRRGSSWEIIREKLIPKGLVYKKDNSFFVTNLGCEVITLIFEINVLKIKLTKTVRIENKNLIENSIKKCKTELSKLLS